MKELVTTSKLMVTFAGDLHFQLGEAILKGEIPRNARIKYIETHDNPLVGGASVQLYTIYFEHRERVSDRATTTPAPSG